MRNEVEGEVDGSKSKVIKTQAQIRIWNQKGGGVQQ
jgi:hypothetical protein